MQDDALFFSWFAGFTDGEGCFQITKKSELGKNRQSYTCTFHINLRADDYKILTEIKEKIGLGQIYKNREKNRFNPILHYKVFNREECLKLVELFDQYPLRAKKAADFAIWRLAVIEWSQIAAKNQYSRSRDREAWSHIAELSEMLKTSRIYQEFDEVEAFGSGLPKREPSKTVDIDY